MTLRGGLDLLQGAREGSLGSCRATVRAVSHSSLQRVARPKQDLLLAARRLAIRGYCRATVLARRDVRRAASLGPQQGLVLNLHSVSPVRRSLSGPISPETFDELLVWLKRHFRMVSLGEIAPGSRGDERPFAVLSFDDGYRDFLDYAMPLLERHRVRANLNIVPSCVESGLPPWNVFLLDLLATVPSEKLRAIRLPGFSVPTPGPGHDARVRFSVALSRFLKLRSRTEREPLLDELLSQLGERDASFATPMLSSGDLAEVAGRHEVGLHSWAHDSMEFESDDFFTEDVDRCLAWSTRNLPQRPTVYAFPNGSHRQSEIEIALSKGMRAVLLVEDQPANVGAAVHPRVTVYGSDAIEVRTRITRGG